MVRVLLAMSCVCVLTADFREGETD
jgi:hypothetical protein